MEQLYHYDLYENEGYDPLHDREREQLFNDPFWILPLDTIEDWAKLSSPPSLPDLY